MQNEPASPSPEGQARARQPERWFDLLFLLGLAATVGFVLWLPVFPTGDGPVHLYYAQVVASLLAHQPAYAHDYAIRHLIAPYLVHYLALISLEHFVAPAMAEKLFIAIIFVTEAFGFRFLARALGRHAAVASVWMLPLLFSWSLGGGFLNCCFATGVLLWAYGVWVRLGRGAGAVRLLAAFAALLLVLVLSHPVPLLVLLLFAGSDLLLGVVGGERRLLPQAAALGMTCVAFIAPVMLAAKGQAAAALPGIGFHLEVLLEMITGMRLGYFGVAAPGGGVLGSSLMVVSRIGLLAIPCGVVLLLNVRAGGRRLRAEAGWRGRLAPVTPAGRLLLIALVFLAATVFFPLSLNNSYFFPQRMWDIVWLLILACGAAASVSATTSRWVGATGALLFLVTAAAGAPALVPIAKAQQRLARAALPAGKRGLYVAPDASFSTRRTATSYPVFYWSGVRAFAASHDVLLNSPWLELTILPVRNAAGDTLLDEGLPMIDSESPMVLTHLLGTGAGAARQAILSRADFLLYVRPEALGGDGRATRQAAAALLGDAAAAWQCQGYGFYAVCDRKPR